MNKRLIQRLERLNTAREANGGDRKSMGYLKRMAKADSRRPIDVLGDWPELYEALGREIDVHLGGIDNADREFNALVRAGKARSGPAHYLAWARARLAEAGEQ